MTYFLLFLCGCFLAGTLLWNQKPAWQVVVLMVLSFILVVVYLVFAKL